MSAVAPYDPLSLRADAPDRPPHWRWLRAERLIAQGREPDRRRDDGWVLTALKFQRQLAAARTDPDAMDALSDRQPVVFWCHRICFHPTTLYRAQVEARLLARDYNAEQAAARTGLSPTQLEAYRLIFFDVRDRLNNLAWMVGSVFGADALKGFNPKTNTDLMLKFAGWQFGSLAVDRVSGRMVDGRAADNDQALHEQLDQADEFDTRLRSQLAGRAMPVNDFTAPTIFQHAADLRKRADDRAKELAGSGEVSGEGGFVKSVVLGLGAVQIAVTKKLMASDSPLATAIGSAAEPRAVDLFRMTSGGDGPSVTLGGVKFPEVTADDRK